MWGKPKILFLHIPIYVNICKNVSEMNKEAKWMECGCRAGNEKCVLYFSRHTQTKAPFRRRIHGAMRESEVAVKSVCMGAAIICPRIRSSIVRLRTNLRPVNSKREALIRVL
jgi:hypothetical protein